MRDKKAFTIIELLTVLAILGFVLVAVISGHIVILQYSRDTVIQAELQGKTRIAVEKMIRNIRTASEATCPPAGDEIILTFDPKRIGGGNGDPWMSRYELSGSQILYYPNTSSSNNTVIIDNVQLGQDDKLFEVDSGKNVVTVILKTKNISEKGTQQDVSLITTVNLRNAY